MDLQYLAVLGLIAVAAVYSGYRFIPRSRKLTSGGKCSSGCGCSSAISEKD
ncbi:MAG: hypothetical protein IPM25_01710 [Chloracidobacterium sp.]|nr:hypothetical protein [Chloracidobacterium sp.]